jgi:type I restriction enzyme S subunit
MPNNWKTYKLSEVADTNISSLGKDSSLEEILYLDTGSVTEGRYDLPEKLNISEAPSRAKRIVKHNDLIYSTVRPNQKHYALIKEPQENLIVSTGFCVLTPKKVNPEFLYYSLTTSVMTGYLHTVAEGSTTTYPSIKPSVLEELELGLPPLKEQTQIANILSAIDDKIENNLATNKTLEDMAMALYKHWFVDFGPFQDGEFIDSELGLIPKGWEVKTLRDFINLNPRLTIPKSAVSSFVEMKVLPINLMSVSNVARKEFKSGSKFQNNDTLFARITPCLENGKTAFVDFLKDEEIAFGSTEFLIMRAKQEVSKYWVYCLARDSNFRKFSISTMVGSSGRQRVQNDPFLSFELAKPRTEIFNSFSKIVEPWFSQVRLNTIANQTLTKLRDTLLPKLISGEVRLKEFREQVETII